MESSISDAQPPTCHQLFLALSKLRASEAQFSVVSYLAAFTVPAPPLHDPITGELLHWVVGAGQCRICDETGLSENSVIHALWGDKRAYRSSQGERHDVANPDQLQKGLVPTGVVRCWDRGRGRQEGIYSLNAKFEEWAVTWRPVAKANNPTTLREVLRELRDAGYAAPWGAPQRFFFTAPRARHKGSDLDETPRDSKVFLPVIRRKGKIACAAPQGAVKRDPYRAPQGAVQDAAVGPGGLLHGSSNEEPASRGQQQQGWLTEEDLPPAGRRIVALIKKLTGKPSFFDSHANQPIALIVQAVCDSNVGDDGDVGFVLDELRDHRGLFTQGRWKPAFDLAAARLRSGPPGTELAPVVCADPECIDGFKFVMVDGREVTVDCPVCRPAGAAREGG